MFQSFNTSTLLSFEAMFEVLFQIAFETLRFLQFILRNLNSNFEYNSCQTHKIRLEQDFFHCKSLKCLNNGVTRFSEIQHHSNTLMCTVYVRGKEKKIIRFDIDQTGNKILKFYNEFSKHSSFRPYIVRYIKYMYSYGYS